MVVVVSVSLSAWSCRKYFPKNQTGSGLYSTSGVLASYTGQVGAEDGSQLVLARLPVNPAR